MGVLGGTGGDLDKIDHGKNEDDGERDVEQDRGEDDADDVDDNIIAHFLRYVKTHFQDFSFIFVLT